MPKETLVERFRRYEGNWEVDAGKLGKHFDDKKYIKKKHFKKRKPIMISILKGIANFLFFPIIKLLVKFGIDNMSNDLIKYISANKKADGSYSLGIETSEFQRAAYKTPRKWDNKVSDIVLLINEKIYERKQKL